MRNKIKKFLDGKRFEYFLLILILLGAIAVRFYKINSPIADWHSWRQVDTAAVGRIYVETGINILYPKYYDISSVQTGVFNPEGLRFVEFPLYNIIHAFLYKNVPNISFEVWGRIISIFFSIVASYVMYLMGKKLVDKKVGLFACFFYSFLPFNVYYSRVILPEAMATSLAISSVWLFWEYLDKHRKLYLFAAALCYSFSILVKPYTAFYALPIVYLAVKKLGIKGIITNIPLMIAIDIALIPFFLWRAWLNVGTNFIGIPHLAWAFNGDGIRFRPAFWRWIFGERLGNLILGGWGLVPFSMGILSKVKNKLHLVMLFSMFLYVAIVATASVRHDYYQTILIPAVALSVALGMAKMIKNKAYILAAFCVFMMLGMSAYQIKEYYKVNHPEFVEVGKIVDEKTPKDALVIAPDNGNTVFLYYTKRQGWPILETNIDDAIRLGADYYVSVNNDPDTANFRNRFESIAQDGTRWIILDLHKEKKK